MQAAWENQVEFVLVYIREAHAIDSHAPYDSHIESLPLIEDPSTNEERQAVASTCVADLSLGSFTTVVDGVDNAVSRAYSAWPDRLYLVDRDGKLAYVGIRGPFGFNPDDLRAAIEKELKRDQTP